MIVQKIHLVVISRDIKYMILLTTIDILILCFEGNWYIVYIAKMLFFYRGITNRKCELACYDVHSRSI